MRNEIALICPNLSCGRTIIVPDNSRGRVVRCAHCNQPFLVPPRPGSPARASVSEGGSGGDNKK